MKVKVGINGVGRIGRSFLRAVLAAKAPVEIVAMNDLASIEQIAHLLKYDTVLGPNPHEIRIEGNVLHIGHMSVRTSQQRDITQLPWGEVGADVIVESTGIFTDAAKAAGHLQSGARKVLIAAPATGEDITIVYGVNHQKYDGNKHHIISNASCTTNCLAPMVKVLHDGIGIESGWITTIHAFTQDQNLQDGFHKDLRRARAAANNIVPTKTGAAKAIGLIVPELSGKLDGYSVRVPIITGSLVDFVVVLTRPATAQDVNDLFKAAAQGELKNVLRYTEDEIVSSDIVTNPASCIFDAGLTKFIGASSLKVMGWYDNEWGFSNRLIDVVQLL
ncbi:type I glyceraldehyde-3-phosphate dehydrogenase [Rhizobium sp.]|uniref:type I glyceraldehyde-3-phosphate dehydrogenase n=1 Tax=Rhizobium sp. TaxID=391 RepID=UPI000E9A1353|nr:type I glyceraldehyde-3-phosphate dehydrogenase [Rhizobium sp.]